MENHENVLTGRQQREINYHEEYARKHAEDVLGNPFSFEIVSSNNRRWWNAHWAMYSFLLKANLVGRHTLVVGCGFGHDALYLSKLGAKVDAFDLSSESLSVARRLAEREQIFVVFKEMSAEKLQYPSNTFDCVVVRDILHHVEIRSALNEIKRVSKNNALFMAGAEEAGGDPPGRDGYVEGVRDIDTEERTTGSNPL